MPAAVLVREIKETRARGRVTETQSRLRSQALELLGAEPLIEPRYTYRFAAIDREDAGVLSVRGETLSAPWLVPASGVLTALACCVATIGERLEARVRALLSERRASLALSLDQVGNELLLALGRLVQDRMLAAATRQGLTMAGELRSGDPGLALPTQRLVLALAGAETVGVAVNAGCVMRPLKSISMVLGVGVDLPPARWSRCDHCPRRARCRVAA